MGWRRTRTQSWLGIQKQVLSIHRKVRGTGAGAGVIRNAEKTEDWCQSGDCPTTPNTLELWAMGYLLHPLLS